MGICGSSTKVEEGAVDNGKNSPVGGSKEIAKEAPKGSNVYREYKVLILGADADPLTPMQSDDPDEISRLYGGKPEDWRLFGDKLRPGVGPFFRAQQYFVASTVCWVFLAIMLQAHCLCLNCWDDDHNQVGEGGGALWISSM